MLKYEKEIDTAFASIKRIPFNGQKEIVNDILVQFFDQGKQNVILSAPTGVGKSIIGAVVAKAFKAKYLDQMNSITMMHTNSLVEQYSESFEKHPDDEFFQIKGASNYTCELVRKMSKDPTATGESCVKKTASPTMKEAFCDSCEFDYAKSMINRTENLITNNSYFFISVLWSGHLRERTLNIFDEAHTLNDSFVEHTAVYVSVDRLDKYIKECDDLIPTAITVKHGLIEARAKLEAGMVDHNNYRDYLNDLKGVYSAASMGISREGDSKDLMVSLKYTKAAKKFADLTCKISDLNTHEYEHALDLNKDEKSFTVKPIFIGKQSDAILGKYNLFMSATLPEELMYITMNLERSKTGFIKARPVFSPESKTVITSVANHSLNFTSLKDPKVMSELKEQCSVITSHHTGLKEKGLLIVPSFYLGKQLSTSVGKGCKVFLHESSVKIATVVKAFKAHKGPAILISPSIFEGLDFKDDDSRYQIIVKAPYASLGDERIKYICSNYPDWYRLMALMKIVQGIGRSTRSMADYSTSYILDKNAVKLFESRQNVWKDEFHIL